MAAALLFCISILSGCSDSRLAAYHFEKAKKHGFEIKKDTIFESIPILVKGKDGHDSLIYVQIPCICPEIQIPKSIREIKIQYRYDLKKQKARDNFLIDSINKRETFDLRRSKLIKRTIIQDVKKKAKNEAKKIRTSNLFLILLILISILAVIIIIFKPFKNIL